MTEEIVKAESTSLARPSFIPVQDFRGAENISKDDIQMPRIGLAQALSPQIEESDPKHIPGLGKGDMFNNLTQTVYGKELIFTVIRSDKPRGIEFHPLASGGGIKDFNVPLDDPRMQFGPNGEVPIATKFYDYVVMLLPSREIVALSMKGSNLKTARQLNSMIKFRQAPSFSCKFKINSVVQKNSKGTFSVFTVSNDGWVDEDTYLYGEGVYEQIKDKTLDIEREPGVDEELASDM